MRVILGTAAALAIFFAGYFHIFDKRNAGYDGSFNTTDTLLYDYTDTGVTQHK
jgi:hypothetical protein